MFHQLWERFRVSLPVGALSESEVDLIMQARVETDTPYNLDDLPDIKEEDVSPKLRR
jgi:hypothetical protein